MFLMNHDPMPLARVFFRRRFLRAALAGLWLLSVASAFAQLDSRQVPVAPLRLLPDGGEVGVELYLFENRERFDGAEEVSFSNRTMREYILQRFVGYAYHPRLLDIRGQIELGLMQQTVSRSGGLDDFDTDSDWNGLVGNYDLQLHFLREHPISTLLFANRDRRAIIEIFSDRQLIESERIGGIIDLKRGPLPMQLAFTRAMIDEYGQDSRSHIQYDSLEYSVRNEIRNRILTEFRYRYQDYSQQFDARTPLLRIRRELDYQYHDAQLFNTIYLTPDRGSYLSSVVRFFNQTGDIDLENFFAQSRLNLRHTPNFRTYYLASLLRNEFDAAQSRTVRGEVGLDHRLYRSLDSHLDLHGRRVEFDGATDTEFGVTGRLGYRKTTPWGMLSAGYSRTLDRIEREGGGIRRVLGEEITLSQSLFTFLERPGVIPQTLVVRLEPLTGIPLIEGFDYETRLIGNRLELRALPGGSIPEGTSVFVDYDVLIEEVEFLQDSQSFNVRHDFERLARGLALYYRYQSLTPRDLSDDLLTVLEFSSWLTGLQYQWRALTWTTEYEDYDSNFTGYSQFRNRLEGTHNIGRGLRLGWYGAHILVDHDRPIAGEDQENISLAGLTLRGPLRERGWWELEGRARREQGLIDETLLGVALRTGVQVRRLRIEGGGRIERLDRGRSERDRFQLFLQLSRQFGRRR